MPVSQLTVYSSSDAGAPTLTGTANSLVTLLDAVLVTGYGAKSAAGWTKPIANAGNCGCWKLSSSGTGNVLFINDNGPNVTSTFKEAWATGWESITSIAAPVGAGGGQFPLPPQLLTTGHVSIRKSTTADAVTRPWTCFADAYTFYLFMQEGAASTALWFGDTYALKAYSADAGRCMIVGHTTENNSTTQWDLKSATVGNVVGAHYAARTWGGGGGSVAIGALGDSGWTSGSVFGGSIPCPNGPDNSIYLAPLRVTEASGIIRGRYRGLYHVGHAITVFSEGQVFGGVGDFAGKTFQISATGSAGGFVAVEISNTVETN